MSGDLAYVFGIGPGELEKKAKYLLESIRENVDVGKEDIYVYLVNEEESQISDETIGKFKDCASLIRGPTHIEDYPVSSLHNALLEASKRSDKDYLALLDTDIILRDNLDLENLEDYELHIKPEGLGNTHFWTREESQDEWRRLFDKFGFEYPEEKMKSSADGKEMAVPYYNSGVIITKNNKFPKRWKDLSRQVWEETEDYYSEMVALAMLATEYEVNNLEETYNYPSCLYLNVPKSAKVIHYHDLDSFYRNITFNKNLRKSIRETLREDYSNLGALEKVRLCVKDSYKAYFTRRDTWRRKIVRPYIRPILVKIGLKNYAKKIRDFVLK